MIHSHVSQWSLSKKIVALILAILLMDFAEFDGCDCGPNDVVSVRTR